MIPLFDFRGPIKPNSKWGIFNFFKWFLHCVKSLLLIESIMPMPQLNVDNISILDRFDFDSIKLKRSSWNGYFDPIEIFAERLLGIILSKFPVRPPPEEVLLEI